MNHLQDPHPTPAQLQAFDAGRLPHAERGPIERHLQGCPACCAALDTMPEGTLEALLRAFAGPSAGGAGDGPAPPGLPAALVGHPRYRILEVLGAGGMGVVYKAIHRLMERVVAVKVIDRRLTGRPDFVARFRREVKAAARLSHPNIVTAYDADQAGETHFLVMEYVAGTSLDREVERRGPLPVREACDLVRQAALGLQYAHERGTVHRDIKPHNLLLTPGGQVKILDFGLARVLDEGGPAATPLPSGNFLGTPDYVAPEQARDPGRADIRADVYSLGCTLYHLLAGHPPFPAGTALQKLIAHQQCPPPALTAARDDVPAELTRILERMLAKDPAGRYPTPADVAADLLRVADPAAAPPALAPRRPSWRVRVFVAGALAAVAVLSLVVYLVRPPAASQSTPSHDARWKAPAGPPPGPLALAPAEELVRQKQRVRDQAVNWFRTNNRWGPGHPAVADAASHIDKDFAGAEAFQIVLGPGLVKSGKATLLVGRAGILDVFELGPELARDFPGGDHVCGVRNYSTGDDLRRATPRVLLSDLALDDAADLFPERPIRGSVAYRIRDRRPGKCSLRLTFYFSTTGKRAVLLPRDGLPEADQGTLPFSFPPLSNPQEVMPGPDVVFVEFVTQDAGRTIVESNAAAAAVRVMAPEAVRP
jgi:serine/threonine protein kinase